MTPNSTPSLRSGNSKLVRTPLAAAERAIGSRLCQIRDVDHTLARDECGEADIFRNRDAIRPTGALGVATRRSSAERLAVEQEQVTLVAPLVFEVPPLDRSTSR